MLASTLIFLPRIANTNRASLARSVPQPRVAGESSGVFMLTLTCRKQRSARRLASRERWREGCEVGHSLNAGACTGGCYGVQHRWLFLSSLVQLRDGRHADRGLHDRLRLFVLHGEGKWREISVDIDADLNGQVPEAEAFFLDRHSRGVGFVSRAIVLLFQAHLLHC